MAVTQMSNRSPNSGRFWLSVAGLGIMAAILLLAGYWILSALLNPAAAGCHNAPLRNTRVPQIVGVLVAIVGFVSGRVTARPKIAERSEVTSRAGADGHDRTRARAALVTQAALTGALLFIACLIAFETLTLASNVWPITCYLRCANEAATLRTLFAAFAFCFLAGRWLWLPTTPQETD